MRDPSFVAERLAGASVRRPWLVVGISALLTLLGLYVSITRFAITTETDQLLQADSAWLLHKDEYQAAFPHLSRVVLVVVDGPSPEAVEDGAQKLAEALVADPAGRLKKAWRPDGGPFFDRNGLLFLPVERVKETVAGLVQQQPTLLALSGDPSLRGLARLMQLGARQGALDENANLVAQITSIIDRVLKGEPARLSWQGLLSGQPAAPGELRKFVLIDPVLDFKALQPGGETTAHIRRKAATLGLTPEAGFRVRLTGLPPLADEEFATISEGAPLHLGLTVVAIAAILWFALRSGRIIFAVLVTMLAGLVMTIGAGLLMVGRFNVISVAVAALFLGLGVDFGIQVAVRYRDERFKRDDVREAIRAGIGGVGWSLTLAAGALLVGFFSFLPTSFRGVSELGLITGVGMIIAFLASLTLLPALITLLPPPIERSTVETPWLAKVDHWILGHRKLVIGASIALVVAGLPFLFRLEFDANPMHLRSAETEAVATFLDLSRQPDMTPNTISVLAPSVAEAGPLAAKLAALPEVSRVVTPATFVPPVQEAKLAILAAAREDLAGLRQEQTSALPPSDAEMVAALRSAAGTLEKSGEAARRLAASLTRLADAAPERRQAAQTALTGDLPRLLSRLRSLLAAEQVTLESLPPDIRDDWVAGNGRARIEVSPSGDANNNDVLERFTAAVKAAAPNLTGGPVDIVESRAVIVRAFVTAAGLALVGVFLILSLALRNAKDVALTLGPLVIATIVTLEVAHLIGMPLNLANIIALPLMLAVGVAFHIYYMIAWRNGVADMLASSLTRAIFFSSLATGFAFGSLWLSHHPGTASMGKLLTISLVFTLLAAFIVVPAFLGPPRQHRSDRNA